MNDNKLKHEEEIDLKELIMILWKRKLMIISITLIFTIFAGVLSIFILSPVYDTNLNIVISMPETYVTRYGEYKLPISTNQQYINLIKNNKVIMNTIKDMGYDSRAVTIKNINERISIGVNGTETTLQNSFMVTVSADNPEESLMLAESLYENYIEFIDIMIKERAISFFNDSFTVKIKTAENLIDTTKEIIEKNEEILAITPQTINQKEAMQKIQVDSSDYVVIENIINPNYTDIENIITLNKQTVITNESLIREYNQNIEEINLEKAAIDKYYESGHTGKLESDVMKVVDVSVYLLTQPIAPIDKTSPSNAKNVLIGGALGGVLSVMIVFFQAYWKEEI